MKRIKRKKNIPKPLIPQIAAGDVKNEEAPRNTQEVQNHIKEVISNALSEQLRPTAIHNIAAERRLDRIISEADIANIQPSYVYTPADRYARIPLHNLRPRNEPDANGNIFMPHVLMMDNILQAYENYPIHGAPQIPLQQQVDKLKAELSEKTTELEMYHDAVRRLWDHDPGFVQLILTRLGDNKNPDGSAKELTFEETIGHFAAKRLDEYMSEYLKKELMNSLTTYKK